MQRVEVRRNRYRGAVEEAVLLGGILLLFSLSGCGGSTVSKAGSSTTTTKTSGPQTYFAPLVFGNNIGSTDNSGIPTTSLNLPQTYTVDDTAGTFSQTTYQLNPQRGQQGPQVINAGTLTAGQRGLRSLTVQAHYYYAGSSYAVQTSNLSQSGNFMLELAGQAGGLAQLTGQPAAPIVAATECPNFASAQTYQFLTIPAPLLPPGTSPQKRSWDPTTETAYGSVDISSSGSTVKFQNISQFTLTGARPQQSVSSETGACGATFFGNTVSVPAQGIVIDPGKSDNNVVPQATLGIGANSGLLVEDNGATSTGTLPDTSPALPYENVLGAGTGAVGLPKPSSAVDVNALVGAQYLGFIYGAGVYDNGQLSTGWSSHLASFGSSSVQPSCPSVAAATSTTLYGGDFTNDDPASSSSGFGLCDFAIDLGPQSSSNNGLFLQAKISIGASYAGNATGTKESFPAVAITGQIGGKYAIFVLGVDSTQPWAVYLLQSN